MKARQANTYVPYVDELIVHMTCAVDLLRLWIIYQIYNILDLYYLLRYPPIILVVRHR